MREIEAKFSIIEEVQPADLVAMLAFPAGLYLADTQHVKTLDIYLDTADLHLVRHGYALRIRRKDGRQFITLKSSAGNRGDGIQNRLEIEKPLGAGSQVLGLRAWPRDIRKILASVAGKDAQWQPRCMIAQEREKQIVMLPSDSSDWVQEDVRLAELSIDRVEVLAPLGNSDQGQSVLPPATQFAEIETELLSDAHEQSFIDLATWFGNQKILTSIGGNKLARGLRAVAGQPLQGATTSSGIQPDMHMADACRLIWRQQLVEMVLNEAGVHADSDIEFVHDMRVATRRPRAAHVLLGDFFKRKKVKPHLKFFTKTAERLGGVRNLDVALKKLAKYRRDLPADQRKALKPLAVHWKRERKERLAQLVEWLDGDAYALAIVELDGFCSAAGAGARLMKTAPDEAPAINQVRHVLPGRIQSRFETVRSYELLFEQPNPTPLTALHSLRIDCKYLRYVLEFSSHLLGDEGQTLIQQLKHLQNVLGDLNDADVARAMLQNLPAPLRTDDVIAYIEQQETIIETVRKQARSAHTEFVDRKNRLMMAEAIANI